MGLRSEEDAHIDGTALPLPYECSLADAMTIGISHVRHFDTSRPLDQSEASSIVDLVNTLLTGATLQYYVVSKQIS